MVDEIGSRVLNYGTLEKVIFCNNLPPLLSQSIYACCQSFSIPVSHGQISFFILPEKIVQRKSLSSPYTIREGSENC